jgi:hypothetical protein
MLLEVHDARFTAFLIYDGDDGTDVSGTQIDDLTNQPSQ